MPNIWRLIPLSEGTGLENMAVDSWLLDQHTKGLQPPTLRFYTWKTPTISLGYHQKQFPAHWKNLHYKGRPIDLVRRPTGGRAVLHQGELTYALVTSGITGSRRDVYQQLCQFLIKGWHTLGVTLTFGDGGRSYIKNPNCFASATSADLVMANGYKFIGSAQVYRDGCVLQHGSIRLNPDMALYETVFKEAACSPPRSSQQNLADIIHHLVVAAEESFQVQLEPQSLDCQEIEEAMTTCHQALA